MYANPLRALRLGQERSARIRQLPGTLKQSHTMKNVLACLSVCFVTITACDSNPTTPARDAATDRATANADVQTTDVTTSGTDATPATDAPRDIAVVAQDVVRQDATVVPSDASPRSGCAASDGSYCQEFSVAGALCTGDTDFVAMCSRLSVTGVCAIAAADGGTLTETQFYYSPLTDEAAGRALCAGFNGTFRTTP